MTFIFMAEDFLSGDYYAIACFQLHLPSEMLITANKADLKKACHIVVSLSSSERISKYNS
jgi:hypothetical protein